LLQNSSNQCPYHRIPLERVGLQGRGRSENDCPATPDLELEGRYWFTEETEPAFGNAVAIAISPVSLKNTATGVLFLLQNHRF
jgi:hypothetical protein